jgi:hypothetical protein
VSASSPRLAASTGARLPALSSVVAVSRSAGRSRRALIAAWPLLVVGIAFAGGTGLRVPASEARPATERTRPAAGAPDTGPRAPVPISSWPAAPAAGVRPITLAFTGDILVHRRLWEAAAMHARGAASFDFRPLLARLRPVLSEADLAICHLETPLSPDDRELSSYPVFETPHELAPAIAWGGYDGCSTASNHSLDGGAAGVAATLGWLDRAGLGHAGTARTPAERARITTYEVHGVEVAHLSYTWSFNGLTPDVPWRANRIHVPRILADAARADRRGADLVVVSVHWGLEYTHTPTAWQREVAERLTRSPAIDLIVGHHAHVVQPIAKVHGTWVAYGLGNVLSGMTSSLGTPAVQDGVVLVATAERRGRRWRIGDLSVVPTLVEQGTWRVLPIDRTLARRWPSVALRAELRASRARTLEALAALGARPRRS